MSNGIALGSAVRSGLLSIQNTSALFETTNLRLSTGKKVNSVFDDPINFLASSRLSDQSSDVSRLLDGISMSLRTIESATNAATALEGLLENAQGIIDSASSELSGSGRAAKITGTKDLRSYNDLTDINGVDNGDVLIITVTDPESTGASISAQSITINTNDSLEDLVAEINSLNQSLSQNVVHASINSDGGLSIEAGSGRKLRVELTGDATATDTSGEFALAEGLGFSNVFQQELVPGGANVTAAVSISSSATLVSNTLLSAGVNASRTTALSSLTGFTGIDNAGDTLTLHVDTGNSSLVDANASFALNGTTVENLVDYVNTDSKLKTLVEASYDEDTGKISIRTLDASVKGIVFDLDSANGALDLNLGFGTGVMDGSIAAGNDGSEYVAFGASAGALLSLERQYDGILAQVDTLVGDSSFKGTNLLAGDTLTTYFTANRSSKLETTGTNFSAASLGLSSASFVTQDSILSFTNERLAATDTVRDFSSSLVSDLNIIKTRQTFAQSTIDTLDGAADDLTLADQEKESANLLALQTRQQLGIISLSLTTQAEQSILRLF